MWLRKLLRGIGMFLCFLAYFKYFTEFVEWTFTQSRDHMLALGQNVHVAYLIAMLLCVVVIPLGILLFEAALHGPFEKN